MMPLIGNIPAALVIIRSVDTTNIHHVLVHLIKTPSPNDLRGSVNAGLVVVKAVRPSYSVQRAGSDGGNYL